MSYTKAVLEHLAKAKPPYKWLVLMDTLTGRDTAWRDEHGSPIVYETELEALREILDDMTREVDQAYENGDIDSNEYDVMQSKFKLAFKTKSAESLKKFIFLHNEYANCEYAINEEDLIKQIAQDENMVQTLMNNLNK